jgi:prepilin-type N-terminal cleavage/methylation domain-containing protein
MIGNSTVEQFNKLDMQAIKGIKDAKLRKQALKLKGKQGGFTLLELLVVVAVLAIVAGTILGGITGVESRSASGSGANSIAAVESLTRAYRSQGTVLNELDSLMSQDCSACVAGTTPPLAAATLLPSTIIGAKIGAEKLLAQSVPGAMVDALRNAGITKVRVLDSASIGENAGGTAVCGVAPESNLAFPCNTNMTAIDIPGRMFDPPASATGNRGRGFAAAVPAATDTPLPIWRRGTVINGSPDNRKVGAGPTDVLVALGFGNNLIVGNSTNRPQVNSAPTYGGMNSNQYSRYLTLWNVGTAAGNIATDVTTTPQNETLFPDLATGASAISGGVAKFTAVVDTRGDFLDEEYAEASGQKQ